MFVRDKKLYDGGVRMEPFLPESLALGFFPHLLV